MRSTLALIVSYELKFILLKWYLTCKMSSRSLTETDTPHMSSPSSTWSLNCSPMAARSSSFQRFGWKWKQIYLCSVIRFIVVLHCVSNRVWLKALDFPGPSISIIRLLPQWPPLLPHKVITVSHLDFSYWGNVVINAPETFSGWNSVNLKYRLHQMC